MTTVTSPTATPLAAAVAVTTEILTASIVILGTLLTVVVTVKSVRYSVLTPIH
jgi:hypothetical protein